MTANKVELKDITTCIENLNRIPDKHQWKTTTSRLFKVNLLQLLSNRNKMKWIELGSAQGHTTLILSSIADTVVSVDFDDENCKKIEELGMNNVTTKSFDLYSTDFEDYMKESKFNAAFIDAIHDEEHVSIDIKNCRNAGVELFVFDDYGGFQGVRSAVDNFIASLKNDNVKHRVTYVGMYPGGVYENTHYKILQNWEGIIVELAK
jgi:hypothetical protein